jgi:hypothetical protein
VSDPARLSLRESLAELLNAELAKPAATMPGPFYGSAGSGGRTAGSWTGESEDLRRRDAVEAARKEATKPTRGAVIEVSLHRIAARASGLDDPAVRLAAIGALAAEALRAFSRTDRTPDGPEDAREALDWRRSCDEAYTDGIVGRKCGLGPADRGLLLDTDRSRALAQAFALGWSIADEAAAFDDVAEAARLLLKFGDADSRDALREALDRLPCRAGS